MVPGLAGPTEDDRPARLPGSSSRYRYGVTLEIQDPHQLGLDIEGRGDATALSKCTALGEVTQIMGLRFA